MPRKARIDKKGYYYHIIARGQRKNPLFFSYKDYNFFIKLLDKTLERFDIDLYAFCLMKNHYHLLLKRNKNALGVFFKYLHTKYALYFNDKYKLSGHVFQGRYKSFIVLNDRYLYALLSYIHNNPVKSGMVNNIEDYKYSSYNFYNKSVKILKNIKKLDYNLIGKNLNIESYIDEKESYIGTRHEFIQIEKRKIGREKGMLIEKRKNINMIQYDFEKICSINNIDCTIRSIKRKNADNKKKFNILIYELTKKGYTITEIAEFFNVHKTTVSRKLMEYKKENR